MQEVLDELGDALPEDSVEEIKEIMSDLEGNMNKIEENGNRASGIVRGILLYSRGKDDEYIPTDLHQLTKEYVSLFARIEPWWLRITSRQRYNPTPAASAEGLVVKNGSNILSLILSSIPIPLS